MRANSRRRPTETFNPQPTPDHRQFTSRDSDASSRPSNIGSTRSVDLYTDRGHQTSAIRSINTYLSSHASLLSLRAHPISSAKEIIEVLNFLLNQLEYPCSKIEDDLFIILKSLNCPYKVNKSTLRAPNTPHNWPSFLALIHWLVQICMYKENLGVKASVFVENDSMLMYAVGSYGNFIRGDDDFVEALDGEFVGKLEKERDSLREIVETLEKENCELGTKLEVLRAKAAPTGRERLEKDKTVLEEDLNKFHVIIAGIRQGIEGLERVLEEKKKEVEVKVEERKRIDEENEELRKRVEEQSFNTRDAERMKRALMAVERDIGEAENERSSWEEKTWDVDAAIGQKFKEVEALAMECNQAVRRLKLGSGFQYLLNSKGSTPAQVMGIDYKSIVKPGLESFADEIKKNSMTKLEELISLQQHSSELTAKIESKRNHTATLQSHIDEVESQLNLLREQIEEYPNRCVAEAKKLAEDVQMEAHALDVLEREAAEILKDSELKLQEAIKQSEEEIQMHATELFAVVDSVSRFKEHVQSKISETKSMLSETVVAVSDAYKHSLPAEFGICFDATR